jgi:uncharacterized membrane protein
MPPITDKKELRLHQLFEVGVLLKGANAALEIVLGGLLLFVNVGDIVRALVSNELLDDPNDFLATHLYGYASHFSAQAEFYSALYLLSHGVIKVFLVVGLLRNKLWAYPASLAVLALFVAYQTIKFLGTHSIPLALLTIFDLALMWLVWHEYRRMLHTKGLRS